MIKMRDNSKRKLPEEERRFYKIYLKLGHINLLAQDFAKGQYVNNLSSFNCVCTGLATLHLKYIKQQMNYLGARTRSTSQSSWWSFNKICIEVEYFRFSKLFLTGHAIDKYFIEYIFKKTKAFFPNSALSAYQKAYKHNKEDFWKDPAALYGLGFTYFHFRAYYP